MASISSSPFPTSPPSALTPNPTANFSLPSTTLSSAGAPTSLSASSPATPSDAQPRHTKVLRWSQESPPTGKSTRTPSPSFREVLVAGVAASETTSAPAWSIWNHHNCCVYDGILPNLNRVLVSVKEEHGESISLLKSQPIREFF